MCSWSMVHYLAGQEKGRTEEKKQTILEMLKDGVA